MSRCSQRKIVEKRKNGQGNGQGNPLDDLLNVFSQSQGVREPIDKEKVVQADDPEVARKIKSGRGDHYRIVTAPIPKDYFPTDSEGTVQPIYKEKFWTQVVDEGEPKRVFIHKLSITPLDQEQDGHHLARIHLVYSVADNFAFTTSVLLGSLGITAVFTSGWFFVDEAGKFVDKASGVAWTAIGTLVTIYVAWKVWNR